MEFHAIILCGSGKRFAPLNTITTSGVTKTTIPKALMPIGNRPIIANPLSWSEKAGFSKITVVCHNDDLSEVRSYVEEKYTKDRAHFNVPTTSIKDIHVVGVDSCTTENLIPIFKSDTKSDFVCMAGDFVTDVEPEALLDHHRNRNTDTIITRIHYRNNLETLDKKVLKPDLVVHTSFKNKSPLLLDLYTREKVAQKKSLRLRDSMIIRHANSVVSTDILPATIDICSHKLVNILMDEDQSENDNDTLHKVPTKGRPWTKVTRDIARRSWQHSKPFEKVAIALVDSSATFIRVDNLAAYMEANRWVMKEKARSAGSTRPTPSAKGAATVGVDSHVGENTVLGERTNIKKSVVGSNCTLGKRCRLTGCIVLDGVKIADDVQLESCLVGKNVIINAKAKLIHCTIEGGYEISKDTQAKDETFEGFELGDDIGGEFVMSYSGSEDEDDSDGDEGSEYSDGRGESEDDDGLFDRS